MPIFVNQISAAVIDPLGPRLTRATVTNAIATASTASAEGKRAAHSFRTPKNLNDIATSQFTKRWKINHGPHQEHNHQSLDPRIHRMLDVGHCEFDVKLNRGAA